MYTVHQIYYSCGFFISKTSVGFISVDAVQTGDINRSITIKISPNKHGVFYNGVKNSKSLIVDIFQNIFEKYLFCYLYDRNTSFSCV